MMPQTSFGMQNTLNMFQQMGGQTTGGFQPHVMQQQPSFGTSHWRIPVN